MVTAKPAPIKPFSTLTNLFMSRSVDLCRSCRLGWGGNPQKRCLDLPSTSALADERSVPGGNTGAGHRLWTRRSRDWEPKPARGRPSPELPKGHRQWPTRDTFTDSNPRVGHDQVIP